MVPGPSCRGPASATARCRGQRLTEVCTPLVAGSQLTEDQAQWEKERSDFEATAMQQREDLDREYTRHVAELRSSAARQAAELEAQAANEKALLEKWVTKAGWHPQNRLSVPCTPVIKPLHPAQVYCRVIQPRIASRLVSWRHSHFLCQRLKPCFSAVAIKYDCRHWPALHIPQEQPASKSATFAWMLLRG